MISSKIGHALDPLVLRLCRALFAGKGLNPNSVTLLGALCALAASLFIAFDHAVWGAFALLVSGAFDLMDGAIARSTDRVTPFGGFLDSVLDRYSDLLVMGGILVSYARRGDVPYVLLSCIAAIGTAIIPYARARADAARLASNTGLLERPERLLILLCGLFFGALNYAVVILAVLTHVTVLQRIMHARRPAERRD